MGTRLSWLVPCLLSLVSCLLSLVPRLSFRQRVRPQLELEHLARGALAALHVERRARADGGPEAASLPAAVGIVNSPVQPLGVEPSRVWNAKHDPFPVLPREQTFGRVSGIDGHVPPETERVELVHPRVVAGFDGAPAGHA